MLCASFVVVKWKRKYFHDTDWTRAVLAWVKTEQWILRKTIPIDILHSFPSHLMASSAAWLIIGANHFISGRPPTRRAQIGSSSIRFLLLSLDRQSQLSRIRFIWMLPSHNGTSNTFSENRTIDIAMKMRRFGWLGLCISFLFTWYRKAARANLLH